MSYTDVLDEYLLDDVTLTGRELGSGSYSSVLELTFKGLRCAGKKIHKNLYEHGTSTGPEVLERYGNECELLSQLRHPHVVQFLGLHFEEDAEVPIVVMEYLPLSLTDCLEEYGVLPTEISYSILRDVAVGLHFLHDNTPPIIHRDVTANNVLLTSQMTAKISDLGMAKILNLEPARMIHHMTVCPGTLSYMPPEALVSDAVYDTKLDCFSYGVLMIHVLCGVWPITMEYLQPDPKNPNQLCPLTEIQRRAKYLNQIGHNHSLMKLIKRCLSNIPSERPNTATILKEPGLILPSFPPLFKNRVEMLTQISSDASEKQRMHSKILRLQSVVSETETELQKLTVVHAAEVESLKEQVARLEFSNAVLKTEAFELKAASKLLEDSLKMKEDENLKLRQSVHQKQNELEVMSSVLHERMQECSKRIRQAELDFAARSKEREAMLQRLCKGNFDAGLLVPCKPSRDPFKLSKRFDEFFLSNADEMVESLCVHSSLSHFEAQQAVCRIAQMSYDSCKCSVLDQLLNELEKLFHVSPSLSRQSLQDTKFAFGLLSGGVAAELNSETHVTEIYKRISSQLTIDLSLNLDTTHFQKHIRCLCELAWQCVTCVPPAVMEQPPTFSEELQDREFSYWNKGLKEFGLVYTRPVLYHSYEGVVGSKGWVGNEPT